MEGQIIKNEFVIFSLVIVCQIKKSNCQLSFNHSHLVFKHRKPDAVRLGFCSEQKHFCRDLILSLESHKKEREREGSKKDNPHLQRKNMCVMQPDYYSVLEDAV